ncbi:hypothetical protein CHU98_g2737 [Xylaria longipes]|nr:hypothetical protein CHU98_g2737 [Xylaria longipes]
MIYTADPDLQFLVEKSTGEEHVYFKYHETILTEGQRELSALTWLFEYKRCCFGYFLGAAAHSGQENVSSSDSEALDPRRRLGQNSVLASELCSQEPPPLRMRAIGNGTSPYLKGLHLQAYRQRIPGVLAAEQMESQLALRD